MESLLGKPEMTLGYWISPNGREHAVHPAAPHTHAGWAIEFLGGEQDGDPVMALLKRGWIRVSCDTISVFRMDAKKRHGIAEFIRAHQNYYQRNSVVFVEDEKSQTTIRTDCRSLRRPHQRRLRG